MKQFMKKRFDRIPVFLQIDDDTISMIRLAFYTMRQSAKIHAQPLWHEKTHTHLLPENMAGSYHTTTTG